MRGWVRHHRLFMSNARFQTQRVDFESLPCLGAWADSRMTATTSNHTLIPITWRNATMSGQLRWNLRCAQIARSLRACASCFRHEIALHYARKCQHGVCIVPQCIVLHCICNVVTGCVWCTTLIVCIVSLAAQKVCCED